MRTPMPSRLSRSPLRVAVALLLMLALLPALTSRPVAAASSSITITSRLCPAGTDLTAAVNALVVACPGLVALDYTINGPGFAVQVSTAGGTYVASGLAPGLYYLTQGDYSVNYGVPVAFCSVGDENGAEVVTSAPTSVLGGSQSPIDLAVDGYSALCEVFNVDLTAAPTPPPAGTDAEVFVSKWACPDGTTATDLAALQAACTTELEGVDFTIEDFAGDAQTDDTGGQPARASFTQWKIGGASLTESIPAGYGEPIVFCGAVDDFGTVIPGYDATGYAAVGGRIGIDIPAAPNGGLVTFSCEWFNIPGAPPTDDAEVYITKWACPEGFASEDYAELSSECSRELEGIDFTIEDDAGQIATDDTGGQPARAAFTPWHSGSSTITEAIPTGYGVPVAFCYASDDVGDVIPGYELTGYPVTDGRISVEIPSGAGGTLVSFSCDWYNLLDEPAYAGISVHTYGCPQGVGLDATFEELAGTCLTVVRGATFEVQGADGYAEAQTTSGIDLFWENLTPGDYTVSQTDARGYRDSKVACAVGSEAGTNQGPYEEVDVTDGGISATLEADSALDCIWYNLPQPVATGGPLPSGPATLVIVTYTCAEGYDHYATKADPTEECDETADDVSFTLRGGRDSSLTRVTGEDDDAGTATFPGLPAGSYLVEETYASGVAAAFVWDCTSTVRTLDQPFTPFATIGPDGRTKVSVVPGETLTCAWYDVPGAESEGTTGEDNLRVVVLDCPGDLANESSCEPAPDGVAVTLSASGAGQDVELLSDDDGIAAGAVEPGTYDIEAEGGICFADSDAFADDGTLDIGEDPVDVTVYRCEE